MQADEHRTGELSRAWSIVERILHPLSSGLIAGVIAGLVGAGGSRVATRIVALTADPCGGLITANENRCGVFTVDGTLGLIVFGSVFFGGGAGVVYASLEPWLRPLGRWRGAAFGVVLLAMLGFTIVESNNPDFNRFGSPGLNVTLFALLFPLYGSVVAPVFDAVMRRLPDLPPRRPIRIRALPGYLLMAFTVFAFGLAGIGSVGLSLPVLSLLAVVHELGERVAATRERGGRPRAAYALPLVLIAAGSVNTVRAIARIMG